MRCSATAFTALVISFVGLAQPVLAADFPARPVYKVEVAAPLHQWTGCYIGGDIGAGWLSTASGADTSSESSAGFAAGGQFGCDYQAGAMVFGIRNQMNWADLKSSVWINSGTYAGY